MIKVFGLKILSLYHGCLKKIVVSIDGSIILQEYDWSIYSYGLSIVTNQLLSASMILRLFCNLNWSYNAEAVNLTILGALFFSTLEPTGNHHTQAQHPSLLRLRYLLSSLSDCGTSRITVHLLHQVKGLPQLLLQRFTAQRTLCLDWNIVINFRSTFMLVNALCHQSLS